MDIKERYKEICRACMKKEKLMKKIFNTEINSVPISQMLSFSTPINIRPDDGLPTLICYYCLNKLIGSYKFQQLCIDSDLQMRLTLKTLNDNDENKSDSLSSSIPSIKLSNIENFHDTLSDDGIPIEDSESDNDNDENIQQTLQNSTLPSSSLSMNKNQNINETLKANTKSIDIDIENMNNGNHNENNILLNFECDDNRLQTITKINSSQNINHNNNSNDQDEKEEILLTIVTKSNSNGENYWNQLNNSNTIINNTLSTTSSNSAIENSNIEKITQNSSLVCDNKQKQQNFPKISHYTSLAKTSYSKLKSTILSSSATSASSSSTGKTTANINSVINKTIITPLKISHCASLAQQHQQQQQHQQEQQQHQQLSNIMKKTSTNCIILPIKQQKQNHNEIITNKSMENLNLQGEIRLGRTDTIIRRLNNDNVKSITNDKNINLIKEISPRKNVKIIGYGCHNCKTVFSDEESYNKHKENKCQT